MLHGLCNLLLSLCVMLHGLSNLLRLNAYPVQLCVGLARTVHIRRI